MLLWVGVRANKRACGRHFSLLRLCVARCSPLSPISSSPFRGKLDVRYSAARSKHACALFTSNVVRLHRPVPAQVFRLLFSRTLLLWIDVLCFLLLLLLLSVLLFPWKPKRLRCVAIKRQLFSALPEVALLRPLCVLLYFIMYCFNSVHFSVKPTVTKRYQTCYQTCYQVLPRVTKCYQRLPSVIRPATKCY